MHPLHEHLHPVDVESPLCNFRASRGRASVGPLTTHYGPLSFPHLASIKLFSPPIPLSFVCGSVHFESQSDVPKCGVQAMKARSVFARTTEEGKADSCLCT